MRTSVRVLNPRDMHGWNLGPLTPTQLEGHSGGVGTPGGRLQPVLMRHPPPAICQNLGGGGELGGGSSRGSGGVLPGVGGGVWPGVRGASSQG